MQLTLDKKEVEKILLDYIKTTGLPLNTVEIRNSYSSTTAEFSWEEPIVEKSDYESADDALNDSLSNLITTLYKE